MIDDPSATGEPVIEVRGLEVRFAGRRRLFGGQKEAPSAVTASVGSELGRPDGGVRQPGAGTRRAWSGRVARAVDGVDLTLHEGEVLALAGESDAARRRSPGRSWGSRNRTRDDLLPRHAARPQAPRLPPRGADGVPGSDGASTLDRRSTRAWPRDSGSIGSTPGDGETEEQLVAKALSRAGLRPPERFYLLYPHEPRGAAAARRDRGGARARSEGDRRGRAVSNLDASVRGEILQLLMGLRDTLRLSILIVTHDLGLRGPWPTASRSCTSAGSSRSVPPKTSCSIHGIRTRRRCSTSCPRPAGSTGRSSGGSRPTRRGCRRDAGSIRDARSSRRVGRRRSGSRRGAVERTSASRLARITSSLRGGGARIRDARRLALGRLCLCLYLDGCSRVRRCRLRGTPSAASDARRCP